MPTYAAYTRVAFLLTMLVVLPAVAADQPNSWDQANQLINQRKLDDGLAILMPLAQDAKRPAQERFRYFWRIFEVQSQNKRTDAALETSRQMLAAYADDDAALVRIYLGQADLYWQNRKTDEALAAQQQAIAHAKDDAEVAINAHLRATNFLMEARKFAPAFDEAAQLPPLLKTDVRAAVALTYMSQCAAAMQDWDKAQALAQQIIDEFPQAEATRGGWARQQIIELLHKQKKPAEIRVLCGQWENTDPDPQFRQRWAVQIAYCFADEKNPAAALAAYRHLLVAHAGENFSEPWYETQNRIVELTAATGDTKAALQEAHILLDAAAPADITNAVWRIANLFAQLDKNKIRANQFIAFQLQGPTGTQGNPLDDIGYPDDTERRQAFAAVFPTLGNDALAMHHRATLCLYLGLPHEALYYSMEAFRKADSSQFQDYAIALLSNGLRPVRGYAPGLGSAATYILYGPNGQAGQAGATETLADPFQAYAAYSPAAPFVMPSLSPTDLQTLTQLQATLQAGAVDPAWSDGARSRAFVAMARLNQTLDSWPGAAWYDAALTAPHGRWHSQAILSSAVSAAKGKVLHLGNVWAFLQHLPALDTHADADLTRELSTATPSFQRNLRQLTDLQKPEAWLPKTKPMR